MQDASAAGTGQAVHLYPSLVDRTVLITGGTRGLGRAMALALVEQGARVAITGTSDASRLAAARDELARAAGDGARVLALTADVRSVDACRAAIDRTLERFGAVHALVNNAAVGMGIMFPDYPVNTPRFWDADPAECARMIDTNITGALNMAIAVTPHLVAQRFGKIVNISTGAVTLSGKGFCPYGPSKAALESMAVIWAKDLADHGVDVNLFLPGGATDTDIIPPHSGREQRGGGIMSPSIMGPGIAWLCADDSNGCSGGRYIARDWNTQLPPGQAALGARSN